MKKNKMNRILTATTAVIVGLAMSCAPVLGATKNVKEETVYVITDGSGTATETIVSDHLVNKDNSKTLVDESDLSEIENVKGDEKFKQDGNTLEWNASGEDIYYQGYTDKSVPVTMDVTYYLNGKQITGEKLQGKSGDVKIKIDYHNDAEINGTKVPFVVMTGLMADKETFKNVEVDNGKVIDNGNDTIVVGMAIPGLKAKMGIDSDEIPLGDSVTITGTADKFDCEDMMTIVTNEIYEDIDTSEFDDMDLDEDINQLDKASKKLVEGTQELYDGVDFMYSKSDELEDGVDRLNDGAQAVSDGTKTVKKNTKKLAGGANTLATGLRDLKKGVITARDGSKTIAGGLQQVQAGVDGDGTEKNPGLVNGAKALEQGAGDLETGLGQLEQGASDLKQGASDLEAGAEKLTPGLTKVEQGAQQVSGGISGVSSYADASVEAIEKAKKDLEAMKDSMNPDDYNKLIGSMDSALEAAKKSAGGLSGLETGAKGVADGASALTDGVEKLGTGAEGLKSGAETIDTKLGEAKTGATDLKNGASTIKGGLQAVQSGLDGDGTKKNPGLVKGAEQLYSGLDIAAGGTGKLSKGANDLANGAGQLDEGMATLNSGAKQLADGMETFDASTGTLIEGIGMLDKGSNELKKGMSKYYKEGIKKLVDMYNDDLKGLTEDLDDVMKAGKDYDHFSKVSSGMESKVHFVYKTEIAK